MKITVYYCLDYHVSLEEILKNAKSPYDVREYGMSAKESAKSGLTPAEMKKPKLIFTLNKNSKEHTEITQELAALGIEYPGHATIRFTKEESKKAEWLLVNNTCMKIDTDDTRLSFSSCGNPNHGQCFVRHRTSPIYCDRKVKWGNHHFFYASYYYGYEELFCSERAKELLQQVGFPLAYESLFRSKPPFQVLPDVYHIVPCNVLPPEAILTDHMPLQSECPVCGMRTYDIIDDGQLMIDHHYLHQDAMIYGTPSMFGPGWSSSACIISQAGYQYILEHNMERGLRFVPIIVK